MSSTPGGHRFDIHVHLAGVGTQGSGCWTSARFRKRPSFLALRMLMGISRMQMERSIDQDWAAALSALTGRSSIDFSVALGFDGVYDEAGELDLDRSQLIVPDEWVFEVANRFGNLLPAPSINPYARDALHRLEKVIERGAVMIKWLPIVQAFDPASSRSRPFLERLAQTRIPLLIHAGTGESTFATVDPHVGSLTGLVPALEMGIPVICAHTAAPVIYSRSESELPILSDLLRGYPNLWVDNSGLANAARFPFLPRFADDELIHSRTLHGSDYPVPAAALFYPRRLGVRSAFRIQRISNLIEREAVLKREIGFGGDTFEQVGDVLANLDRWI